MNLCLLTSLPPEMKHNCLNFSQDWDWFNDRTVYQPNFWNVKFPENCGGSEWAAPTSVSVISRLFWAKGNFSCSSRETSAPPFNYLEELELRALPIEITRDNFFCRATFYLLNIFFFSLSCEDPVKPPRCIITSSLTQEVLRTSVPLSIFNLSCMRGLLTLSCMWGSHTYACIKFGYILSINI